MLSFCTIIVNTMLIALPCLALLDLRPVLHVWTDFTKRARDPEIVRNVRQVLNARLQLICRLFVDPDITGNRSDDLSTTTVCVNQGAKLRKYFGFPFGKPPQKIGFPKIFQVFRIENENLSY